MNDPEIIELFWQRDESAVTELKKEYGTLCRSLAKRILNSDSDAEEVENDTYLKVWQSIPPARPDKLLPFLAVICRRTAIDRLKTRTRKKRGGGGYESSVDELSDILSGGENGDPVDKIALKDALDSFLAGSGERSRDIFMRRYFWSCSIEEIAKDLDVSESTVKP